MFKGEIMQMSMLARDLRNRQRTKAKTEGGIFVKACAVMDTLTDAEMVTAYTTCSCCEATYPMNLLKQMVETSDTIEEFFEIQSQLDTEGHLLSRPQPQHFPFSRSKAIAISHF
jgi:hypothetical protein